MILALFGEVTARITNDPDVRFGKPCIRGHRITVQEILEWLSSGAFQDQSLADYPQLEREHFLAVYAYAAELAAAPTEDYCRERATEGTGTPKITLSPARRSISDRFFFSTMKLSCFSPQVTCNLTGAAPPDQQTYCGYQVIRWLTLNPQQVIPHFDARARCGEPAVTPITRTGQPA